ncbi:L,D-transpeptidase [Oscillospiraceae bacterium N12]|jgi:lipoprotein-anchoring transpeptidase ErfK/SrfK|uniref:L,D-transpeptidase n=1 Tax=Jilunia laotingensis TaxID=2763675 RepID=A0A926EYH8_9BACT|nr:L,D-transpeptidase [Jilunia laotingensis]MBC8592263.1 L,D-transpeptidase [Jilunia laotingensis]
MNRYITYLFIIFLVLSCLSCQLNEKTSQTEEFAVPVIDSLEQELPQPEKETPKKLEPEDISIIKELKYDKYTLEDIYPYKDTTRNFQWDKIKERLALLENIQQESPLQWGILQNYKNRNGEAPLVKKYKRDAYRRIADTLGVERYQSIPLYMLNDTLVPERYGQDGELARILDDGERFMKVIPIFTGDEWYVPRKYIKLIPDTVVFDKAIMVDRKNQNITTLEQAGHGQWTVRSMNPATTGRHLPPYAQETPLGIFVLQEKKSKMIFLKDGSQETGGFAPYASRFSDGGYIHGVPTNVPQKSLIEYSPSLGTTPRSHMCVRNATSHAKFIYDWAPVNGTIVFVLE